MKEKASHMGICPMTDSKIEMERRFKRFHAKMMKRA